MGSCALLMLHYQILQEWDLIFQQRQVPKHRSGLRGQLTRAYGTFLLTHLSEEHILERFLANDQTLSNIPTLRNRKMWYIQTK